MGCNKITDGVICTGHYSEPRETECLEAVWSQGRACKKCTFNCYRAGWDKSAVDNDNRKLVERKNNE